MRTLNIDASIQVTLNDHIKVYARGHQPDRQYQDQYVDSRDYAERLSPYRS